MFTGIIEFLGKIDSLARSEAGARLRIDLADAKAIAKELKIGSSIAVNGCCLTAIEIGKDFFTADMSPETLKRTSFERAKQGRIVNLELPVAVGARLGGHFVQGHVDGVGTVETLQRQGENWRLAVSIPQHLRKYVAEKGSLAVDGISLTVACWADGVAEFAIIPHTYANTNLRETAVGNGMNLECDILAKYVEGLMRQSRDAVAGRWTVERLVEEGF
jgi:riboflavin synthase